MGATVGPLGNVFQNFIYSQFQLSLYRGTVKDAEYRNSVGRALKADFRGTLTV